MITADWSRLGARSTREERAVVAGAMDSILRQAENTQGPFESAGNVGSVIIQIAPLEVSRDCGASE
jgi:hypothetical protein